MICALRWGRWLTMLFALLWASFAQASDYGCKGLESLKETPVVE
jgi:hypothetical protein